jgi:lysyl-tRNA synthetase class 2
VTEWRPTATRERLALRAALLAATRDFFDLRGVLEVDTPWLVNAGVTDVNLGAVTARLGDHPLYLHTSPEYAMKRLLAAGIGDIYQLCHVARADEQSRLHNPEFTLLEWYRCGFSMTALIKETALLLDALLLRAGKAPRPLRELRYQQAFIDALGIDPLVAAHDTLATLAVAQGLAAATAKSLERDGLLDFLISTVIGPTLGRNEWLALTHYPASQAALARLDDADPRVALRFEIYAEGIELANGFEELASAAEQRARFEADNRLRELRGLPRIDLDERLLAALESGLPACAGVALGFDRAVMLASGAASIDEVIAFPTEIA